MNDSKALVVIIDDNRINNFICEKIINEYALSIVVKSFLDSEEGLKLILENSEKINLLLLDLSMPVMDGWEILCKMKEENISIPIVILTSSVNNDDKIKAESYPFVVNYLVKPVTYDILTDILENLSIKG